jgi:hypothetical protein
MRLYGKIGVYGRSLGGIVTTYLSSEVDMIIADRTFGNFNDIAHRKFYNKLSPSLFKIGSCGWQVNNDWNIVKERVINYENSDNMIAC